MTRLGRRRAQQWLAPLREALRFIRSTGDTLVANGHPVMEIQGKLVHTDLCVEGFTRLIARVLPNVELDAIYQARNMLGTGQDMTVADIDAALAEINRIEPLIARLPEDTIKSAVLTESIAIELQTSGLEAA